MEAEPGAAQSHGSGAHHANLVGTCRQAMAAQSPKNSDAPVLAPHSVTRDAGDVTELTSNSWLLPQGNAVASFFGANGPAHTLAWRP